MNFFHVPSFEDHLTMKIWIKNWNLPKNKKLFKTVYALNDLFNSQITLQGLRKHLGNNLISGFFPLQTTNEEKISFQMHVKDDFDPANDAVSHFYKKMHFLIFFVEISSTDVKEITEILNPIKRFAFNTETSSIMIVTIFKAEETRRVLEKLDQVVVIHESESIDAELFSLRILPIFMNNLKEKMKDMPNIDKEKVSATREEFESLIQKNPISFVEGKILKLRGDVALMMGCVSDSLNYYMKALEVFNFDKKTNNNEQSITAITFWISSVLEAIAACCYLKIKQKLAKTNVTDVAITVLTDELIQYTNEAIINYMSEQEITQIYELRLKLLGFYSLIKAKKSFISQFNYLRDDLSKISFDPRTFLYIGDLASNAGLKRLAIRSIYECSRLLKKTKEFEPIREKCFELSAHILNLDIDSYKNNFGLLDLLPKQITYIILVNLLEIHIHNRNTERALHYYLLLMKKYDIEKTFKVITEEILWEFPFYNCEYDVLPFIQRMVPKCRQKVFKYLGNDLNGYNNATESVFIYDPRNKAKYLEFNWIAQEEATIVIYLTNPLPIYVKIDSLTLETEGVNVSTYSNDVTLAPNIKNSECYIKIRPVQSGTLTVKGVKMRTGNLIYFNSVDSKGVGKIYKHAKMSNPCIYEQYYSDNDLNLERIQIAESVPLIEIEALNYNPGILFYNEDIISQYRITNTSKSRATDVKISVRIDYENAHTVYLEDADGSLELDYNKYINFEFVLLQGRSDVSVEKGKGLFKHLKNSKIRCSFSNMTLSDRVYKISIVAESKFRDNKNYIGYKELTKSFKVI